MFGLCRFSPSRILFGEYPPERPAPFGGFSAVVSEGFRWVSFGGVMFKKQENGDPSLLAKSKDSLRDLQVLPKLQRLVGWEGRSAMGL